LLQGAPHGQGQEANKNMSLGAVWTLIVDGPYPQITLGDPEGIFDLSELNVGPRDLMRISFHSICAQKVTTHRSGDPGMALFSFTGMNG
jgi:hypothetical protein